MSQSNIGVYGLGVMGRNLALNLNDSGYEVSVYNKRLPGEENVVEQFLSGSAEGKRIRGFREVREWVESLERPRVLLLMVKAGPPVDAVLEELQPYLEPGDIVIDGGNSHYEDTNRRLQQAVADNLHYVGMGISGGEAGARRGPSLMPGGDKEAWPRIKPILQSMAATSSNGSCCRWMGAEGAGHFVKMVHNGIEYAIMQLLAECYDLMYSCFGLTNSEIAETFEIWNTGLLQSYLVEITGDIFSTKEEDTFVIDLILDRAGQKGTGRWTALAALELGIPAPTITEAVYARTLSSFKDLRAGASKAFGEMESYKIDNPTESLQVLKDALLGATLVSFAEGFWMIRAANTAYEWDISHSEVAKVWQEGCIIRSGLLQEIAESYENYPELPHLLLAPKFKEVINGLQPAWRKMVSKAVQSAVPVPAFTAALAHIDGLKREHLPANLIQAQRDYFGAHTYERVDQPRGKYFHTEWSSEG